MVFSKTCEYGIRSTIFILLNSLHNQRVTLSDIANETRSPESYVAKILQTLVKEKVIISIKGPKGGFEIDSNRIDTLVLNDVVKAIDGEHLLTECCLGLLECSDQNPCPAHNRYSEIKTQLESMLKTTTIFEMAVGYGMGLTKIKNQIDPSKVLTTTKKLHDKRD